MKPKAKVAELAIRSVPNTGSTSTPHRLTASVETPDSITSAQNATIQNAINDCGFRMAGFAQSSSAERR